MAVRAFIAAINRHAWLRVWRLGGKNLGGTYPSMVRGFRLTSYDVIKGIASHGDTVTALIQAHETTGAVQTIRLSYTVRHGIITSGQERVLLTRHPAASQSG